MTMKNIFALLLSLMLFILPCLSLAEESEAIIGGADGPTAIIVAENTEEAEEQPLSLAQSGIFMLKGMIGIFLVTGLIILVLVIMDKVGNRKKEESDS